MSTTITFNLFMAQKHYYHQHHFSICPEQKKRIEVSKVNQYALYVLSFIINTEEMHAPHIIKHVFIDKTQNPRSSYSPFFPDQRIHEPKSSI